MKPAPKLLLATKWNAYWLADPHDALYNTASAVVARKADRSAGRFVGTELDATGLYAITKQVGIGTGLCHIFPGHFLKTATPGHSLTFQYLSLDTRF